MTTIPSRSLPAARRAQRGVVLIVALVVLVLVTILGISSIRTITMQERMAGNSRDRDKAFQAAEAAVVACLAQLNEKTFTGTKLTPTAANVPAHWDVANNWTGTNSTAITVDSTGLAAQPRCLVEELDSIPSYRVTGRAVGASDQTVVMLQATLTFD